MKNKAQLNEWFKVEKSAVGPKKVKVVAIRKVEGKEYLRYSYKLDDEDSPIYESPARNDENFVWWLQFTDEKGELLKKETQCKICGNLFRNCHRNFFDECYYCEDCDKKGLDMAIENYKKELCGATYTETEDNGEIHLRVCHKRSPCPLHNWKCER